MLVTGLTVLKGVHVPKYYRKDVFKELYYAKKYGPDDHCARKGYKKGFYRDWLHGRIMYIRSIDRPVGDKMLSKFNEIEWFLHC